MVYFCHRKVTPRPPSLLPLLHPSSTYLFASIETLLRHLLRDVFLTFRRKINENIISIFRGDELKYRIVNDRGQKPPTEMKLLH